MTVLTLMPVSFVILGHNRIDGRPVATLTLSASVSKTGASGLPSTWRRFFLLAAGDEEENTGSRYQSRKAAIGHLKTPNVVVP
jgi:hypothetical protein